jgi:hypothetical protein
MIKESLIQDNLLLVHLGKMLSEDKRKRWMNLLLETADEMGWPAILNFDRHL